MRAVAFAFACLAVVASPPSLAAGQDQIADTKASEQLFWSQLYPAGGTTLYCARRFAGPDQQVTASAVYSARQMKNALRCVTDRQCSIMNPRYPFIVADLHNYYPALKSVERARRNAQFADVADSQSGTFSDLDCELKTGFQRLEPKDAAKGNIARAIFYMHQEYGLPLIGDLPMLQQWNRMDPPDAEEHARNEKIGALQGTRNRFIDDPALADQLAAD
ncbi:deoxyribonuclease-1 [Pseudomonas cuatrocienegasensis]|uniref:Deoxyribonuclease-1 n=1 Tax=Pseudomonas cuatrocienegasensis TaxID=543360 RepID=A0ABY1BIZ2_9PSED|nr:MULTISPECIES: endonuclease [Pseudomonas]OEC34597.1 endonuclease I [Pseudomonas sp. 21C1]SEQ97071.1 deoxyribonuclease-1 [Pseudomonas cuatrocienegasensis]